MSTKVALGGWAYTRRLEAWDAESASGRSWGAYVLGERLLHRKTDGTRGLSGFARVGTAADCVNRLDLSLVGGLIGFGFLPGRPDDLGAVGFVFARNGSPFLQAQQRQGTDLERAEAVFELTYRAQLGRFFVIQPDLQWIKNPGMDPGRGDALVLGLRGHFLLEVPADNPPF